MPSSSPALSSSAGGLLLKAFEAGHSQTIHWVELQVGDYLVLVASDAMRASVGDQEAVRLPVSHGESVTICRAMDCVLPTKTIADTMFSAAKVRLGYVGLVRTKADAARMRTIQFSLRFHRRVEAQLAPHGVSPGDLVFGAWKLWLLHPRLSVRGAVNYGFWDTTKSPPVPVQGVGTRHDAAHFDYSQVLQPVKRAARRASDGAAVDLLEVFEREEGIAPKFLDPFLP